MRQRYIVPRVSGDEFTFAVVTARVSQAVSAAAFRDNLTLALTEWAATTNDGAAAWKASSQDFNVGDLSEYLPAGRRLRRILAKHGVRGLRVQTYADCSSPANPWTYDTVLVHAD
jgi:hypothetical protein